MNEPKCCPFCGGEVIPPDFEDGDCIYWINHDEDCFLKIEGVNTFFYIYLEAWNKRTHKLKKHKASDLYALYKHDELLAIGTAYELADYMGIKLDTFYGYTYPSTQERMKKRKNGGIYVERIEE